MHQYHLNFVPTDNVKTALIFAPASAFVTTYSVINIGYSMFCVGYGIYTREQIFQVYQLFPILLKCRLYIVKNTYHVVFAAFHLGVCHFTFSHGCVQMGQMNFISSIFC